MRKWIIALLTLWAGITLAATPAKAVFDVQHLSCPACGLTIRKALDRIPGVINVHVDSEAATVTVTFDAQRATAPAIASAITDAGFPAKVKADGN